MDNNFLEDKAEMEKLDNKTFTKSNATNPFNSIKNIESANFDSEYEQAVTLLAGDKLLRPYATNCIVRKTATQGVYKVLVEDEKAHTEVKILDESQLYRDKQYAAGSISKINDNEYEIVYFDDDDSMEIDRYDKASAIEFMKNNRLSF